MISGLRVLSVDASDLDVESVGNRLKFNHVRSELRQLNVNRGS